MQEWRNWQTRRLQVPVVARSCGFKSHLLHSFLFQVHITPPRKSLILRGFSLFIFLLYIKFWKNLPIFCPSLMLRAKTALLSRKFFTYLLYFFHCVYQIHFYSFEHLITITALKTLYLSIFPFISYTGNANTAFAFSFALVPLSLCV